MELAIKIFLYLLFLLGILTVLLLQLEDVKFENKMKHKEQELF